MQVDLDAEQLLDVSAGGGADFFQHLPALADDHTLVAFALTVNVHININKVLVGTLFKALDHNGDAVGNFIAHKQQGFFAHQLGDQLFFRHIGKGFIVKIVRTLIAVGLQHGKQLVTAGAVLGGNRQHLVKAAELLDLAAAGFQLGQAVEQVYLVDDRHSGTALLQGGHHPQLGIGELPLRLKQHQGHIHVLQAGGGGLGHTGVQLVAGGMDAGGVHQHILHGSLGNDAGDAAAGGLGLLGDDGHLFAHKVVGQAGFAHVGATHQRHKDAAGHFRNRFRHSDFRLSVLSYRNGR